MLALLAVSASQLIVGPNPRSAVSLIADHATFVWFNTMTILAAIFGLVAVVIPDTFWRLAIEGVGQATATWVFLTYSYIIWDSVGVIGGLSVGLSLTMFLWIAALTRTIQIVRTIYLALWRPPDGGTIVETDTRT